jgi:hypothetical protein
MFQIKVIDFRLPYILHLMASFVYVAMFDKVDGLCFKLHIQQGLLY